MASASIPLVPTLHSWQRHASHGLLSVNEWAWLGLLMQDITVRCRTPVRYKTPMMRVWLWDSSGACSKLYCLSTQSSFLPLLFPEKRSPFSLKALHIYPSQVFLSIVSYTFYPICFLEDSNYIVLIKYGEMGKVSREFSGWWLGQKEINFGKNYKEYNERLEKMRSVSYMLSF